MGAVRLFTTGRVKSRERVVACRPGAVFSYVLEAGLPLRDYTAVVTLTPWTAARPSTGARRFGPGFPAAAWIYRRQLGSFIGRTVEGLAAAAAGTGPP